MTLKEYWRPTRFKILFAGIILGSIWIGRMLYDKFSESILLRMHPELLEKMKGAMEPALTQGYIDTVVAAQGTFYALTVTKVVFDVFFAYLGACLATKIWFERWGPGVKSNKPPEGTR